MSKGEGRRTWVWALLLFGLYDLLTPAGLTALIGLGLLGAALLEWGRERPGGRTVAAAGLLIISGFLHLARVDGLAIRSGVLGLFGLAEGPTEVPLGPLLRLMIAAAQLLWAAAQLRRFRRALERDE